MKIISMIVVAAVFCVPALAAAQRGGGASAVGVQRVDVQRIDSGRTMMPARDFDIRRGTAVGGETGTRIHRRVDDPSRHRPHYPARRRWNAAHPSDSDPSRPDEGR